MKNLFTICFSLTFSVFVFSQNRTSASNAFWTFQNKKPSPHLDFKVAPKQLDLYHLDLASFQNSLSDCKNRKGIASDHDLVIMTVPVIGKKVEQFGFIETPVMEPLLQDKYPNIRTYTAIGIDDPRKTIKLEVGPQGLQAMIFSPSGNSIISPAYANDRNHYMLFSKDDLLDQAPSFHCELDDFNVSTHINSTKSSTTSNPTGTELRTYRMALGTTGEYSNYHGGTKDLVLAAMVTTMNRINGIYERDFSITMVLVNNTDTLIYLDPDTDPYTNNNLGAILGENQQLCDSLIGFENYDIGHVFGTSGGGLAGVGVICGGAKAWGGTGLGNPVGDVFDVDYVSHEIGHQFGAGHTFNECGGQAGQAYEPGSGVTIMAYAGLCGISNLQFNSIDQFHVASYDQVINYSQNANGNTCPMITETGNTPPSVEVGEGGFFIPFNTPFELTGNATDIDGDSLTYCWEQFDLGPSVHPDSAVGTAPLFRSWKPVNQPTRIFPRIEDLVTNIHTIGELLPQFGRELNFRMTVRDNSGIGGGVDYDQITFFATDSSGNFKVLSPDGGQIWTVGALQTVVWEVANSDKFPVNCNAVNIWLSEDGGYTYPHLVASNRENNGTAVITVPNIIGNKIRIKVKAVDNIFFDISNNNNIILPPSNPDFSISVEQPVDTICGWETATFQISLDSLMGFSESIHLNVLDPITGAVFQFSNNDVLPPSNITLSVTDTFGIFPGNYTFTIQASSNGIIKNLPLTVKIRNETPQLVSLLSPFNGSINVAESSLLAWNEIPWSTAYAIEISDSPDFSNLIYSDANVTQTYFDPHPNFLPNSIYFWRVRVQESECGVGGWSNTFSFQTVLSQCAVYGSEDLPVSISGSGTPTEYSELEITQDYLLTDVDVINLNGTHTWVSDLQISILSPSGDSVLLFGGICGQEDDFNLSFDDMSTETDIPCPPTTGLTYLPAEALSIFNGSNSLGTWILKIQDTANQDGGEVENWSLRLCGPPIDTMPSTVNIIPDSVDFGETLFIDNDHLTGGCSNANYVAEYQITSLPLNGNLFLDGEQLTVGSFFTQSDIDNQLLTYLHIGANDAPDEFGFILTCENGSYIGGLIFDITILTPVKVSTTTNDQYWSLFPNPTDGFFTLKTSFPNERISNIQIVDLLGRVVFEKKCSNEPMQQFDIGFLSSGIYSCQLFSANKKRIGERKLVLID